jgi:glyoxylase-like metal-dependent hydrolase (beta-lactamase superfamily II)
MKKTIFILFLLLIAIEGPAAFAQVDLAGEWEHPGLFGQEDFIDRGEGPEIGDYLGLPLNEAGLRKAESHSGSWLSVPEHQCTPHPAAYQTWGPNTLIINKEYDRITRQVNAIHLDGTYGLDRIVWLDGRPHPSEDALHTFNGFSTGHWEGDTLVVETSHLKLGWLRRNGTPTSELARMTEYYTRYDNYLMVITVLDDPVYLTEPFIRTTEYALVARPLPVIGFPFATNDGPIFYKCFPAEETTVDKYHVPHYLPGANPLLDEFSEKYKVPRWTLDAGTATMYPEFSQRLKQPAGQAPQTPRQTAAVPRPQLPQGIRSMHVKGNVWAVMGGGGNVTVQVGDEGVLVVDTGTEQMAGAIRAEIRKIAGDKPIRYVINTHWHADHTGGNARLAQEPKQRAAILAHENVGLRLTESKSSVGSLVMDTFYGQSKNIYFNGEAIEIIHVPSAHTDSDAIVFFRGSDVVSAGDVIATENLPIFLLKEGGSMNGSIDALNRIIDITVAETRGQGGTTVIPGHGRLYDEADVVEYRDMLTILRDRIQDGISKGKTLQQVKEMRPTLDYDGVFGATTGFWTTDMFIESAYQSLSARKQSAN